MDPFAKQSWETEGPSWEQASFEAGDSSDEEDLYACFGEKAGDELLNYLLSLVWSANIYAKHCCSIAW